MSTLTLKTHPSSPDVYIEGILVPGSGGSVSLSDFSDRLKLARSFRLRDFATDNAYGAGLSTIILNDGNNDIVQDDVDGFLAFIVTAQASERSVSVGYVGENISTLTRGGEVWTVSYDSDGNVASITNGVVTKTILYDLAGNVTGVTVS